MARNDGIDRTVARNVNLTASKIANAQRHNEREKESYTNPDIVPDRLSYNVHFKSPTGSYAEMFEQMKADGVISTRGLKEEDMVLVADAIAMTLKDPSGSRDKAAAIVKSITDKYPLY